MRNIREFQHVCESFVCFYMKCWRWRWSSWCCCWGKYKYMYVQLRERERLHHDPQTANCLLIFLVSFQNFLVIRIWRAKDAVVDSEKIRSLNFINYALITSIIISNYLSTNSNIIVNQNFKLIRTFFFDSMLTFHVSAHFSIYFLLTCRRRYFVIV